MTMAGSRRVVLQDSASVRSLSTSAGQAGAPTYLAAPTARAEVVIALRNGVPGMFVIGPRARASWKSTAGLEATATLHLRPGVLQSVFRIQASELRDAAIPARELFAPRGVERTLSCALESSVGEAALAFARTIAKRTNASRAAELAEAALASAESPRQLAVRLGVSARTLRRLIGDELGVSPRELARFARARRLIPLLGTRSLADIAFECGYSDQAHMSNDTRALFGCSPTTLARRAAGAIVG